MKSHSSLLSVGNLTKPCLSRQVFQGSRRWTGGGNATVRGLKPSRQCSQPGSLNPGAALESDGTVKLIKHSQASSKERAKRGCSRLRPKYGQRSGSGRLTWPDANDAPPVYRVDLTHPVENAEHGKAAGIPPGRFPGKPTARQAPGKRHGEDRKKPRPVCNGSDRPTSIGSFVARKSAEPPQTGKANDERRLSLGASRCCHLRVCSAPRPSASITKRRDEGRLCPCEAALPVAQWVVPDKGGFRKA